MATNQDNNKKKATSTQSTVGAIIGVVLVIIAAIWIYAQISAPCDSFRTWQSKDIPARCLNNYTSPNNYSPTLDSPTEEQDNKQSPTPKTKELLSISGSGIKDHTERFIAPEYWDLEWSYSCSDPRAYSNLFVTVQNTDPNKRFNGNEALSATGHEASGVKHYEDGGEFYLTISSGNDCTWKITAKG